MLGAGEGREGTGRWSRGRGEGSAVTQPGPTPGAGPAAVRGEMRAAGRTARAWPSRLVPPRLARPALRSAPSAIIRGSRSCLHGAAGGGWDMRGGREAWRVAGRRGRSAGSRACEWAAGGGAGPGVGANPRAEAGRSAEAGALARSFFERRRRARLNARGAGRLSSAWSSRFSRAIVARTPDPAPDVRALGGPQSRWALCAEGLPFLPSNLLLLWVGPRTAPRGGPTYNFISPVQGDASAHLH